LLRAQSLVVVVLGLVALPGCRAAVAPSARSLHYVDDELVYSRPASPQGYEAYLKARLALDAEPADPETAMMYLRRAQRSDPRDPHLWATRAEAAAMLGDVDEARASAERALALSPGYPPARRVLASIDGGARSAASPQPPQP